MVTRDEAVVDSSIIVALYAPERQSGWAKQKMAEPNYFHVLDLNYYEVANVLKHKSPEMLSSKDAGYAFLEAVKLMNLFTIHNFSEVIDDAFKLATDFDITVYDAAFVTLAHKLNVWFLTLDQKLAEKLKDTKYALYLKCPQNDSV